MAAQTNETVQPRATYTVTTPVFIPGMAKTEQSAATVANVASVTVQIDLHDLADALRPFLFATKED